MSPEGESGEKLRASVEKYRNLRPLNLVPGVQYGFSDASFGNMAYSKADQWPGQDVGANRRRFAQIAGFDEKDMVVMSPVHGLNILNVGRDDIGKNLPVADGLITTEPNVVLGLCPADCGPILISNRNADFVALLHAGLQGAEKGIISKGVKMLGEMGFDPREMVAGVGPMIGCYPGTWIDTNTPDLWMPHIDVPGVGLSGVEVVRVGESFRIKPKNSGDVMWVEMQNFCRDGLENAGIPKENIGVSGFCTSCGAEQGTAFSHTVSVRDSKPIGRFLAEVEIAR